MGAATADSADPRCAACGWPYDERALRTGDCALCAPPDPEPHVSWRSSTTAKLAIGLPMLAIGVLTVILLAELFLGR